MTDAFPLRWPEGWPRTEPHRRDDGRKFKRGHWQSGYRDPSLAEVSAELLRKLKLFGARDVVISSNIALRLDGLPRSGQRIPDDPGVAVYFSLEGKPFAMARDLYRKPEFNIRALTRVIEGLRQVEREGGSTMLSKAFSGFEALPAPGSAHWSSVLGIPRDPMPTAEEVKKRFRELARERHPDHGGSDAMMSELNAAMKQALEETRVVERVASLEDHRKALEEKRRDEEEGPFVVWEVICVSCLHRYIAVAPARTFLRSYECPNCHSVGFVIATGCTAQSFIDEKDGK